MMMLEHGGVVGNPIGAGLRPCGPCREYVIDCRHLPGSRMRPGPPRVASNTKAYNDIRKQVLDAAAGHCETCGADDPVLFVRVVSQFANHGNISVRNALAVCRSCQQAARGKTIAAWVITGRAPVLAAAYVVSRRDRGLPI